MKLSFQLCPDDLIAFEKQWERKKSNKRALQKYRNFYTVLTALLVWFPFIFIVLSHSTKNPEFRANYAANGAEAYWLFAPLTLPIFLFYGMWLLAPLLRKKMMLGAPIVQEEIQLQIDKNGIQGMEYSMPWAEIQDVTFTKTHLFVADENSAFIIPLRIFHSEFEVHDFKATIQGYWENRKPTLSSLDS
jgi:hypothetical protein